MNARTARPIPLGLTALVALVSALVALAFSGGHDAMAHNDAHAASPAISQKEVALRQDMRKLWEDHITWTRLAVISLTTGSPDTQATVARLLRNQRDIGNAIKPYYGKAAGAKLTALLRQHILIAADLIAAAQKGDQEALSSEQAKWQANADEIAAFLSSANPASWKPVEMRAMMRDHLRLTTDEVVARLTKKWPADVRAYDRIHTQILHMADMLSEGIVAQFPGRFR
ncbi:MAG TPA: hypothetical protein VFV56_03395 [Gaiellaceae bacterium]|nr:hypothetical protein [Gaiellaceae bacterium]